SVIAEATETILKPVAAALVTEGCHFTGILYAGLMLTANGPKVIEFNARFGDPETEVLLPRLETPLESIIFELLDGGTPTVSWSDNACVGVVLAAKGYPDAPEKGYAIRGLETLENVLVFHAGTAKDGDVWRTNGGRVLFVAACGDDIAGAIQHVYAEIAKIESEGLFYRKDIAYQAVGVGK
ncbi:MAG: phosphoribosylamine--glycine ligase, partial [Bacilli bacterium]